MDGIDRLNKLIARRTSNLDAFVMRKPSAWAKPAPTIPAFAPSKTSTGLEAALDVRIQRLLRQAHRLIEERKKLPWDDAKVLNRLCAVAEAADWLRKIAWMRKGLKE